MDQLPDGGVGDRLPPPLPPSHPPSRMQVGPGRGAGDRRPPSAAAAVTPAVEDAGGVWPRSG